MDNVCITTDSGAPAQPEGSVAGCSGISGYASVENSHPSVFKVYRRRWYTLFIFTLMAMAQSLMWNTWGPIASSAKCAFSWTNTDISLLASWGPVMYMLTVFPSVWLAEMKGKANTLLDYRHLYQWWELKIPIPANILWEITHIWLYARVWHNATAECWI